MIEEVHDNGELLALIVRNNFEKLGVSFVTPDYLAQQVAYMQHPAGKQIQPHVHNETPREIRRTNEVLLIKRGKLRVDFFSQQQQYLHSRVLEAGDLILLASGGHGFEALSDLEMIEVKQGPYVGEEDKTRFTLPENFMPNIV